MAAHEMPTRTRAGRQRAPASKGPRPRRGRPVRTAWCAGRAVRTEWASRAARKASTSMHLAVAGAGGPRDVLVDQGAAEIVGPGGEQLAGAPAPSFTQLSWTLSMVPAVAEPSHGVHEQGLPEGRAPARPPLEVDRRRHVDERQRHELGEAAGSRWRSRATTRWRAQERGCSTAPNMIVTFERSPTECAVSWTSSHCSVVDLVGAQHRCGPRRRGSRRPCPGASRARRRSEGEVLGQRQPERRGALGRPRVR